MNKTLRQGHRVSAGALLFVALLGSASASLAEETPVTLKNIDSATLESYKSPQVIDGKDLLEKVRQLHAGLKALEHMSEMISEEHGRRAMKAQIDSIKATLESLGLQIKSGPKIDYGFPAPLPVATNGPQANASESQKRKGRDQKLGSNKARTNGGKIARAMSATTLSQLWGAIERASFRDDKMAVIRQVNRDHYLNTQQAELLIETLTFSKDRRDAVKLLYPKLVDPSKIEVLYRLLDQPAHRREVKREVDQINMNRRLQRAQGGGGGY